MRNHSTMKLGLLPATPAKPRLMLGDFLTGVIPTHPRSADYLTGLPFSAYRNTEFSVCGPASVANYRRLITARLTGAMVKPTQEDVFDLYKRSGNPRFPADDNGVNMQTMLGAVQRGGIGGVRCLGFAAVNHRDLDEMDAAIAIFGGLLLGVDLENVQERQTDSGVWDVAPGSGQWGGHAVLSGAYPADNGNDVITWGRRVRMTDRFIRAQLSEAWVAIFPEHMGDRRFLEGMDLAAFARAYEEMTGKRFPAPVPVAPPPAPAPAPTPAPRLTLAAVAAQSRKTLARVQAANPYYARLLGQYQEAVDADLKAAFPEA